MRRWLPWQRAMEMMQRGFMEREGIAITWPRDRLGNASGSCVRSLWPAMEVKRLWAAKRSISQHPTLLHAPGPRVCSSSPRRVLGRWPLKTNTLPRLAAPCHRRRRAGGAAGAQPQPADVPGGAGWAVPGEGAGAGERGHCHWRGRQQGGGREHVAAGRGVRVGARGAAQAPGVKAPATDSYKQRGPGRRPRPG